MSKKQKKKHKLKAKEALQDSNDDECLEASETNNPGEIIETKSLIEELKPEKNNENASEASKPAVCSVCKAEFESRNKLFEHIKIEGHALPKTITQTTKPKTKKNKAKK